MLYKSWHLVNLHVQTGRQNTVKKGLQPLFAQKAFVPPMNTGLFTFYSPSQYLSSFSSRRPKSKKKSIFSRISIATCKQFLSACCGLNFYAYSWPPRTVVNQYNLHPPSPHIRLLTPTESETL